MFELLLIIVAGIFIFSFVYFKFDFLEPCVIVSATMTFAIFTAISFSDFWGYDVTVRSTIVIPLAIIFFVAGDIVAHKYFKKNSAVTEVNRIDIDNWKIILILVVMASMAWYNYQVISELAKNFGYHSIKKDIIVDISDMIKVLRWAMEENELTGFGRFASYNEQISQTFTYIGIFAFLHNFMLTRFKLMDFKFLLPIIFYLPFMIMSTGRISTLALFAYALTIGIIFYYRKNNFSTKSFFRTVIYVPCIGILFIGAFLLMGLVTGKTLMGGRSAMMILTHYAGIGIPAFDVMLNNMQVETGVIGSHTLMGIYRVLQRFLPWIHEIPNFSEFVYFHGIDTNAYTAFARYYLDYGCIGLLAIMFLLGFFYSFFYNRVKFAGKLPWLVFYGYLIYPLFMFSVEERIMIGFFSTTPIYEIFLLLLFNKILIRQEKFNE